MSLTALLIVWAAITAVLIILLIYRSTLSIHEDDQLFLDESESHMEKEQKVVLQKLTQLNWPLRIFGAASGLLILVIFGIWLWQGLNRI
jgi:uncharacterized membrane protein SpoIIM required for sporulation